MQIQIRSGWALLFVLFLEFPLFGQTPTYSENIATILYQNCTSCHRQGGIGPFKLEGYADAVNNAMAIKTAVSSGYMPPWPPDTTYSRFSHERVINQQQINQIIDWVDAGMPQGNPANEPPLPPNNNNSQLSEPPAGSYKIPTYTITSNQDVYRAFVVNSQLTQNKAITEIEFKPGNKRIVHHILLFFDTSGICQGLDDADPLPGYAASGGIGNSNAKQIGGWVPGSPALRLPGGFGMPAFSNGKFVIQIHYAPGSLNEKDSTAFEVVYKPITPQTREVYQLPVLNHFISMINGPIYILPNQKKEYQEAYTIPIPISVLGVTPHMHLIGRNMTVNAKLPLQPDTVPMIRIKDWNFNWQGQYMYKKPLILPQGTTVRARALYDNTEDNPFNPSQPPALVTAGESTLNEMMLTYFMFATYKPGDEDLELDSIFVGNSPLKSNNKTGSWVLFPNPAWDEIILANPHLKARMEKGWIEITNQQGKMVHKQHLIPGEFELGVAFPVDISQLAAGIYQARIHQGTAVETIRFQKLR